MAPIWQEMFRVVNAATGATIFFMLAAVGSGKAILMVEDGVVKCADIDRCRRFGPEKILCNACIVTCPNKTIEFI